MESTIQDKTPVIPVAVQRRVPDWAQSFEQLFGGDLETDLQRARRLAEWLDARFSVAGIRFGFDSILGLIPGLGDTLATLIGLYPLFLARQHKLGRLVQSRMALNLLADWAVGLIPVLGDLFDVGFKGNLRNIKVLEKALAKRQAKPGA